MSDDGEDFIAALERESDFEECRSLALDPDGDMSLEQYAWSRAREFARAVVPEDAPQCVRDSVVCPVCMEAATDMVVVCPNGHCLCAACAKKTTDSCPECRAPLLANAIPNRALNSVARAFVEFECTLCDAHGLFDVPRPCATLVDRVSKTYRRRMKSIERARAHYDTELRRRAMLSVSARLTECLKHQPDIRKTQISNIRSELRYHAGQMFDKASHLENAYARQKAAQWDAVGFINVEKWFRKYLENPKNKWMLR